MPKLSNLPRDSSPLTSDYIIGIQSAGTVDSKFLLSDIITTIFNNLPAGSLVASKFSNPCKVFAYRNGAQSFSSSSTGKIQFETVVTDTGSNFDASTNHRFTATVAGFYIFNSGVNAPSQSSSGIFLYKNGVSYLHGNDMTISTNLQGVQLTTPPVQMSIGDYVEIFYFSGASVNLLVGTGPIQTYFGAYLLAAL